MYLGGEDILGLLSIEEAVMFKSAQPSLWFSYTNNPETTPPKKTTTTKKQQQQTNKQQQQQDAQ